MPTTNTQVKIQASSPTSIRLNFSYAEGHKYCTLCGTEKPFAAFTRNRQAPDKLSHYCTKCLYLSKWVLSKEQVQELRKKSREERIAFILANGIPCNKCNQVKPSNSFHLNSRSITGRSAVCSKCSSANYKPPTKRPTPESKPCSSCREHLDTSMFYRNAASADGLTNQCRECFLAGSRKNYPKHRERRSAHRKAYYRNNKESVDETNRRWAQENVERRRAHWRKRRYEARKAYVEDVDPMHVAILSNYTCGICGLPVIEELMHLDHCTPIARGGLHEFTNVQVAHRECNIAKKDHWCDEWSHPAWFLTEAIPV